jgi:hypothetical protein
MESCDKDTNHENARPNRERGKNLSLNAGSSVISPS